MPNLTAAAASSSAASAFLAASALAWQRQLPSGAAAANSDAPLEVTPRDGFNDFRFTKLWLSLGGAAYFALASLNSRAKSSSLFHDAHGHDRNRDPTQPHLDLGRATALLLAVLSGCTLPLMSPMTARRVLQEPWKDRTRMPHASLLRRAVSPMQRDDAAAAAPPPMAGEASPPRDLRQLARDLHLAKMRVSLLNLSASMCSASGHSNAGPSRRGARVALCAARRLMHA